MRIEISAMLQDPAVFAAAIGAVRVGHAQSAVRGIATDSREVLPGDIFYTLAGASGDGTQFLEQAAARGAVGAVVPPDFQTTLPLDLFLLGDRARGLIDAVAYKRQRTAMQITAISGSAGKTTLKETVAAIYATRGSAAKSEGNYNSTVGMPLSFLSMGECAHGVLEIGINHTGEMLPLSVALSPHLAILTNVGTAHIGQFGSFEALLAEKMALAEGLCEGGVFLLPQELRRALPQNFRHLVYTVGDEPLADFYAVGAKHSEKGVRCDVKGRECCVEGLFWRVPGRIGVSTLTFAVAAGVLMGFTPQEIREGIAMASEMTPRLKLRRMGERLMLDDTYNASPESTVTALEVLSYLADGRTRAAVLGDMLELGAFSAPLHHAVGEAVAKSGIEWLFTYGEAAKSIAEGALCGGMSPTHIFSFPEGEAARLAAAVGEKTPPSAAILWKASHAMRLGEAIAALEG